MFSHQRTPKQQQARRNLRHPTRQEDIDEKLMRQALKEPDARTLTPGVLIQLQRTIGNQAVSQLIKTKTQASVIQRNPVKDRLLHFVQDQQSGQVINTLAQHILSVINALEGGQWATAYNLLYDRAIAKIAGHKINIKALYIDDTNKTQKEINSEVDRAISKGMYFSGRLDLPEVAILPNNDFNNAITPDTDATLAKQVLPVVLEEWIHMFQHQIQGYLSQATYDFEQTPEVQKNQMLPEGQGRWNMNEVDIYAIYRDLGWASVLTAFKARYKERQRFEVFKIVTRTRQENAQRGLVIGRNRH
jgi:hypothetical protein